MFVVRWNVLLQVYVCRDVSCQLIVCRVPRLNLSNVVDDDDNEVDYTLAMESPLVAAAGGVGSVVFIMCQFFLILRLIIFVVFFITFIILV